MWTWRGPHAKSQIWSQQPKLCVCCVVCSRRLLCGVALTYLWLRSGKLMQTTQVFLHVVQISPCGPNTIVWVEGEGQIWAMGIFASWVSVAEFIMAPWQSSFVLWGLSFFPSICVFDLTAVYTYGIMCHLYLFPAIFSNYLHQDFLQKPSHECVNHW